MALPKVASPRYELTLPSEDKVIQYRPFLVKEEKLLLMAMEEDKNNGIVKAVTDICESCTFGNWDVAKAPMFDIEYVFLNIRAKSVGEVQKVKVLCPDDKKTYADVEVDLNEVNVQVDDSHTNRIIFDESRQLGVVFKYPTIDLMKNDVDTNNVDSIMKMVIHCVDHIFEGEKIYPAKDTTEKEMLEFFEELEQTAFARVQGFFTTMPRLRHEVKVKNPKTGIESEVVLQGINDFFA